MQWLYFGRGELRFDELGEGRFCKFKLIRIVDSLGERSMVGG